MASIARLLAFALGLVLAVLAALLHVWYRGVLAAPAVKRRKAATRAPRRA